MGHFSRDQDPFQGQREFVLKSKRVFSQMKNLFGQSLKAQSNGIIICLFYIKLDIDEFFVVGH